MEDTRKWWYLLQESVFKIKDDIIKNTWKCSLKNNKSIILTAPTLVICKGWNKNDDTV